MTHLSTELLSRIRDDLVLFVNSPLSKFFFDQMHQLKETEFLKMLRAFGEEHQRSVGALAWIENNFINSDKFQELLKELDKELTKRKIIQ